jgi:DNA polymerase-3 subunit delta'
MWLGIQGHDAIAEQFRHTLAAGRLASTYLFVGPEGVGKRMFALQLAQTLLCTENNAADLNPCGHCESCRLIAVGNHPDLDVVSLLPGKSSLAIKQFVGENETRNREGLCHNIALRPMLGRRRVAIIDDADWFTTEAANCLLKTLEEPPPGAVIILVATSRSRLLPTILSRAQIVRFQPLPDSVVRDLVLDEGLAPDEAAAADLAARAGGSVTRARELADPLLWQMRDKFMARWESGELEAPRLIRELEEFINDAGKEAEARRQRFRQFLALVGDKLRESLRGTADDFDDETILDALDRCVEAEEQLDRNANQATLLETWMDDLASMLQARQES